MCNLRFVKLCTVFNDDNISNQLVKNKNDRSQKTAVATDSDISDQAAEYGMSMKNL